MDKHNQGVHEGYYGTGTGTYAHQVGAEQRAAEEARRGGGGGPGGGGGGGEGGLGVVILLGLIAVVALVILIKDFLIAMALATILLAATFRLALPTAGARPGWGEALIGAGGAYLFILVGCVVSAAFAHFFLEPDISLMPGVQNLHDGEGDRVVYDGLQAFILPWSIGLVGALWWLNRLLPPLRVTGVLRFALLAALPTIVYLVAWLILGTL